MEKKRPRAKGKQGGKKTKPPVKKQRVKPVIKPSKKTGVYIKRSVANYLDRPKPAPKPSWIQMFIEKITSPPSLQKQQKKADKKERQQKKQAQHLANLPKNRFKRILYRLKPGRIWRFWVSWRGFKIVLKTSVITFLVGAISLLGLFMHYSQDLPNVAALNDCIQGQTTEYYDRTGQTLLWASKSDVQCRPVQLQEVSNNLIRAVIASEDQEFYSHSGVHFTSILRAATNNLIGDNLQGGSTITQQYIKNAVLKDTNRTIERKIRETILALAMERTFTKDEILAAYLNTISFGSVYDGVEAASLGYFGKSSAKLTVAEAALLAASIPAPGYYWSEPDIHLAEQKKVLALMRNQGKIVDQKLQSGEINNNQYRSELIKLGGITQAEYEAALEIDVLSKVIRSHHQYEDIIAPHFVLETEKRLRAEFGEDIRLKGYKVITTIDLPTQTLAEEAIEAAASELDRRDFDNAAAVAVEVSTGKVLALVGSRGFDIPGFGQTNTATTARDPGSVFKVFDYGALFEGDNNWGPGSTLYDYRTTFTRDNFRPTNYSETTEGPVTIRQALGRSLNIPAVKAMYLAGINNVHDFAGRAGLETPAVCGGGYCGLAGAFGSGNAIHLDETTNAYASFAREGVYLPLTYIDRVYDSSGQLLRQWQPEAKVAFKAETAYLINNILSDQNARFTSRYNLPGLNLALKTGTDDFYKNNLIVGYSKAVSFGVWFGNHDVRVEYHNEKNTGVPKGIIWRSFMSGYHEDLPANASSGWQRPRGIQSLRTDLVTGYQVPKPDQLDEETDTESGSREDIFPSWFEPKFADQEAAKIKIDKVSRRLATECTPPGAILEVSTQAIRPELPSSDPFYEEWMEPINEQLNLLAQNDIINEPDELHDCQDDYPSLTILSPNPLLCQDSCQIRFRATAGTHPLSWLTIYRGQELLETISLIGDSGRNLSYEHQPESSNETLTLAVIDQALYDQESTVKVQFSVDDPIILHPVIVASDGSYIQVTWSEPRPGLSLEFRGDCLPSSSLDLPAQQTSRVISTANFLPGTCRLQINDGSLRSNFQTFSLEDPPNLIPPLGVNLGQ